MFFDLLVSQEACRCSGIPAASDALMTACSADGHARRRRPWALEAQIDTFGLIDVVCRYHDCQWHLLACLRGCGIHASCARLYACASLLVVTPIATAVAGGPTEAPLQRCVVIGSSAIVRHCVAPGLNVCWSHQPVCLALCAQERPVKHAGAGTHASCCGCNWCGVGCVLICCLSLRQQHLGSQLQHGAGTVHSLQSWLGSLGLSSVHQSDNCWHYLYLAARMH
jgi:hypothetical protein